MNGQRKLLINLIGVNVAGALVSTVAFLEFGLFEALIIFPVALISASLMVHLKHKDHEGSNSSDDEVKNLIAPED